MDNELSIDLILVGLCSDPRALPDPVGGSEPKPRGSPAKAFYQIRFINISISVLKSLRKRFQFRASP